MASILALSLGILAGSAQAQSGFPPSLMSYQGFLVDGNGGMLAPSNPINFSVVFRIYGASTGGSPLWTEAQTVTVDKGNFSVVLGEGGPEGSEAKPDLSSVFASNRASDLYLGITVKGVSNTEILPRLRMLTSPYAFLARTANALSGSDGGSLIRSDSGRLVISQTIQSTGSGGNPRGANAVDLQTSRSGASPGQVASGSQSVISGGWNNTASGGWATVPGGTWNEATGNFSLAAGRRAKARHQGAMVFTDSQDADMASTADNQFIVRAAGGVGINTTPASGAALTVSGQVRATSAWFDTMNVSTLTATSVSGFGSVPLGLIAMWSGSADAVPAGWALCNGQVSNGRQTPDLRGRFIVGAGQGAGLSNRNVNDKGGAETVTIAIGNIPPHNHVVSGDSSSAGAHTHPFRTWHANFNHAGGASEGSTKNDGDGSWIDNDAVQSAGAHTHRIDLTSQSSGGVNGAAQPLDNMPPFFALAFIMRVQ